MLPEPLPGDLEAPHHVVAQAPQQAAFKVVVVEVDEVGGGLFQAVRANLGFKLLCMA